MLAACSTPHQYGEVADPDEFARAETRCHDEATARYGRGPAEAAGRADERCDPQSWLCRRTKAWMLKEGNPISTATSRDRLVHRYTQRCLENQGFGPP